MAHALLREELQCNCCYSNTCLSVKCSHAHPTQCHLRYYQLLSIACIQGDTLTLNFTEATNEPGTLAKTLDKATVDSIFKFKCCGNEREISLGRVYLATWTTPTSLTLTVSDASGASSAVWTRVGNLQVSVRGNLSSADLSSVSNAECTVNTGTWGNASIPQVAKIEAQQSNSNTQGIGSGSQLVVSFTYETNQPYIDANNDGCTVTASLTYPMEAKCWKIPTSRRRLDGDGHEQGETTPTAPGAATTPTLHRRRLASCSNPITAAGVKSLLIFGVDGQTEGGDPLSGIFPAYEGCWVDSRTLAVTLNPDDIEAKRVAVAAASQNLAPGNLVATIRAGSVLRSADGASAVATASDVPTVPVTLAKGGTGGAGFGVSQTPAIVSVQARSNGASPGLDVGDVIRIIFDVMVEQVDISTKAAIDKVFVFSTDNEATKPTSIGANYVGEWVLIEEGSKPYSSKTAKITIRDDTGVDRGETAVNKLRISVKANTLRSSDGQSGTVSPASAALPGTLLSGGFGIPDAPRIVSVQAHNTGGQLGIGTNDRIIVEFNQQTNKPEAKRKEDVDAIFAFSEPFAANYQGTWLTGKLLEIKITEYSTPNKTICPPVRDFFTLALHKPPMFGTDPFYPQRKPLLKKFDYRVTKDWDVRTAHTNSDKNPDGVCSPCLASGELWDLSVNDVLIYLAIHRNLGDPTEFAKWSGTIGSTLASLQGGVPEAVVKDVCLGNILVAKMYYPWGETVTSQIAHPLVGYPWPTAGRSVTHMVDMLDCQELLCLELCDKLPTCYGVSFERVPSVTVGGSSSKCGLIHHTVYGDHLQRNQQKCDSKTLKPDDVLTAMAAERHISFPEQHYPTTKTKNPNTIEMMFRPCGYCAYNTTVVDNSKYGVNVETTTTQDSQPYNTTFRTYITLKGVTADQVAETIPFNASRPARLEIFNASGVRLYVVPAYAKGPLGSVEDFSVGNSFQVRILHCLDWR